jgi:hypothetical protein
MASAKRSDEAERSREQEHGERHHDHIAIRQTIFGITMLDMSVGKRTQSKVANIPPQKPMRSLTSGTKIALKVHNATYTAVMTTRLVNVGRKESTLSKVLRAGNKWATSADETEPTRNARITMNTGSSLEYMTTTLSWVSSPNDT